jgi:hypothetical protein
VPNLSEAHYDWGVDSGPTELTLGLPTHPVKDRSSR